MLAKIDESLAKQATQHCPHGEDKKRKAETDSNRRPSKKGSIDHKNGGDMTMVEREAKAIKDLGNYIEEVGGKEHKSR